MPIIPSSEISVGATDLKSGMVEAVFCFACVAFELRFLVCEFSLFSIYSLVCSTKAIGVAVHLLFITLVEIDG